jgi:hypothetical protein
LIGYIIKNGAIGLGRLADTIRFESGSCRFEPLAQGREIVRSSMHVATALPAGALEKIGGAVQAAARRP